MSFLDELSWRGLLHQRTAAEELDRHLAETPRVAYCGFDPTSDSLHIGNLIPIKLLMHWQRAGHKPIVLIGGGTGLIGDPSGRDLERSLMSREQVEANVASQRRIFERLLDFDESSPNAAVIVNNLDWLDELGFIEVLRDVGKHFSVNMMIQKDSVRERLHTREQGISFTEFSYMILQAYDFLHLRRTADCTVQVAGSDQYGNIVAGIDLIRREHGTEDAAPAFGVTAPLVERSDGRKMSKSSGQAVWLSADTEDRTSPYAFYQYWINLPDADVINWMKMFTLAERGEIDDLAGRHDAEPHKRRAQKSLARHMTGMVHGADELSRVEKATEALFGTGDVRGLDELTLAEVFADVPHTTHDRSQLSGDGMSLVDVLSQTSLAGSKRAAREHVAGGAVSINGVKCPEDRPLVTDDLLPGGTILLRRGKKSWHATKWS
ncbi:MAG: tyrosine--tRNA ligase [Planctomycetota bacterium]|jgi:tyrosyl-tRNA synthetase